MTVQSIISRVADYIPLKVKVALRGDRGSPSQFASIDPLLPQSPTRRAISGSSVWRRVERIPDESGLADPSKLYLWLVGTGSRPVNSKHVKPGMKVLDIGAQSGFYSLLLSRLIGPAGVVFAFEPLPANYRILEENVSLNHINNVVVIREAVSNQSGEISFEFPHEEASLVAGPILEGDSLGTFRVPSISLDDFAYQTGHHVHFIKMDVEGAETAVLQGCCPDSKNFSSPHDRRIAL